MNGEVTSYLALLKQGIPLKEWLFFSPNERYASFIPPLLEALGIVPPPTGTVLPGAYICRYLSKEYPRFTKFSLNAFKWILSLFP
jgi:hypothetical protein